MVLGIVNGRGRYSPDRSVRFAVTQEKASQRRAGSPLWHRDESRLMQPDDMLETFSELAVKEPDMMRLVLQASLAALVNVQSVETLEGELKRRAVRGELRSWPLRSMPTNVRLRNGFWCIVGGDVSRLNIPVLCGIRDQFGQLPADSFSLRSVHPEGGTTSEYPPPVLSNQPDFGTRELG